MTFGACRPRAKHMATIRRGASAESAAVAVDSSSGSASVTPAACKKWRRLDRRRLMLLIPEGGALNDRMKQRSKAIVMVGADVAHDIVHRLLIGDFQRMSGRINEQLGG